MSFAKGILVLGVVLMLGERSSAYEPVVSPLILTPARCIALHQGQDCYQKVTINWRWPSAISACIYTDNSSEPLRCWEQATQGNVPWVFESARNQNVYLVETQTQKKLLTTELPIVWVYDAKSRRQSHWRLF